MMTPTQHMLKARVSRVRKFKPPISYRLRDWIRYLLKGERGATGTALSDFLENELLDHVVGASAYTAPVTLHFALFTAAPSDSGGGTEVTGGSYAREGITNNLTNFPAAVAGAKSNNVAIDFGTATASWGTVTHVAIFDDPTAGNLLFWGALTASKTIGNGDGASFAVGDFDFALD